MTEERNPDIVSAIKLIPTESADSISVILKLAQRLTKDELLEMIEDLLKRLSALKKSSSVNPSDMGLEDVDNMGFSVRVENLLKREDVMTVGQLLEFTEKQLRKKPLFGGRTIREIKTVLEEHGLALKKTFAQNR